MKIQREAVNNSYILRKWRIFGYAKEAGSLQWDSLLMGIMKNKIFWACTLSNEH